MKCIPAFAAPEVAVQPEARRQRIHSSNTVSEWCQEIIQTAVNMDFKIGARDWCYVLENTGSFTKGQFDAAEKLIQVTAARTVICRLISAPSTRAVRPRQCRKLLTSHFGRRRSRRHHRAHRGRASRLRAAFRVLGKPRVLCRDGSRENRLVQPVRGTDRGISRSADQYWRLVRREQPRRNNTAVCLLGAARQEMRTAALC